MLIGTAWRKADAAISHHYGSDAMVRRGSQRALPHRLAVVMRMDVNEPGSDDATGGIDLFDGTPFDLVQRDDPSVLNGHITDATRSPRSVVNFAASNYDIVA